MSQKKLRPLSDITLDLEELLFEMTGTNKNEHGLQLHEVIGIIAYWAQVHNPECIETYLDGTHPILYGHKKFVTEWGNE
jgi:hypothetical protein